MTTRVTKLSISVPALVAAEAERESKRLNISKSALVSRALIEYLGMKCPTCGQLCEKERSE